MTPTLAMLSTWLLLWSVYLLWGHSTAIAMAGLLGQLDVLAEQQLELGLSEVREAETSGAALDGVGNAWKYVRDRHNRNTRRAGSAAIAVDVAPSGPPAYAFRIAAAALGAAVEVERSDPLLLVLGLDPL
ncbi:hypothetical protein MRB53_006088 [Persea americana]|uniref:Uncharacterized protein n=1 Tax=Persea americana TaxID=3435 RepID=A0ACC2MFA1_PERAE|nr:hypothetical protein MRB53_006088 [Persea americana]